MKAVCLASAMTVVLLLVVTVAFRVDPRQHRARQVTMLNLACMIALVGLWLSTPDDLGFLHRSLLVEPRGFDLALALFFFFAAYFGGVLQLYNLADRGFSLRMLIDALEDESGSIDTDRLVTGYGGGQGLAWMYDKRMRGLLEGNFVRRADTFIALTARGARIADLFIRVRQFLKLDSPR
jgi:hypothetical protein